MFDDGNLLGDFSFQMALDLFSTVKIDSYAAAPHVDIHWYKRVLQSRDPRQSFAFYDRLLNLPYFPWQYGIFERIIPDIFRVQAVDLGLWIVTVKLRRGAQQRF